MKPGQLATASTAELVSGCRSGSTEAWEELLERYERLVFAIATREGLSAADSADVTQTTFEALLKQLDRIRDDELIASWLMTVARRQTWRLKTERNQHFADEAATVDSDSSIVDPISESNTVMWVYQGLSMLDPRCRELVSALYLDPRKQTYADLASRFDCPVGSIGPTRARCLERLRKLLGDVIWDD